jgi:hypothetical protein
MLIETLINLDQLAKLYGERIVLTSASVEALWECAE